MRPYRPGARGCPGTTLPGRGALQAVLVRFFPDAGPQCAPKPAPCRHGWPLHHRRCMSGLRLVSLRLVSDGAEYPNRERVGRYVTVLSDHGFDQRTATTALSGAPQGTATAGAGALPTTAGPPLPSAALAGCGTHSCFTSRMSIRHGSTTSPTVSGSLRPHTSWRRYVRLIFPHSTASNRRADSGVTEATCRLLPALAPPARPAKHERCSPTTAPRHCRALCHSLG